MPQTGRFNKRIKSLGIDLPRFIQNAPTLNCASGTYLKI
jgi:hypothetical protein